tara:strand:- start:118 stop:579 length:462 start_codon:yes stop_codon:yes gene_type:complete
MKQKYSELNNFKMPINKAFDFLDSYIDPSDPDLDEPNSLHAYQTAERIRKKYPDAKKSDFKGFDSEFTKPLSPVHISQRPLPSVPTGPSSISPKAPKIWDPPARPEDGNPEKKKVVVKKSFVLLNFINDYLFFIILALLVLYLVYGTDILKGK